MSITWNGVSSDTIGVIVERIPNRYVPTRRFSPQQVAGRNGNILLVDKSFPNVEQEYEVYLSAEAQGLPSVARACAEWLMGPDGYCRLEDSYDTTVYREAFLMGGYDLENILNKFGRCTITFSCKPQKYLLTGDTPIPFAGSTTTHTGDVVQFEGITDASITSLSATIDPIQNLHGYANPWPAGGGKNIADVRADNSSSSQKISITGTPGNLTFTSTGVYGRAGYTVPVVTGQKYTISFKASKPVSSNVDSTLYVNNDEAWGYSYGTKFISKDVSGEQEYTKTITATSDTLFLGFYISAGGRYPDTVIVKDLQVELGSSKTSYSPYSNICPITGRTGVNVYVSPTTSQADATTYAVDWTDEAGTVYGGTVDVVTGVLTVDTVCATKALSAFSLVETKTKTKHYRYLDNFFGSSLPLDAESGNLCNIAPNAYNSNDSVHFYPVKTNGRIEIWVPTGTPTSTEVQIAAPIATPLTYQLTPQEVTALVGTNNVWSSSGDVSVTVFSPPNGIVTNPTPFEARPMLEVSGVGEITINGKSIQILESVSDFDIDCEAMEAEDNSKIYCMDFPELSGGANAVIGSETITSLSVVPRWWTL